MISVAGSLTVRATWKKTCLIYKGASLCLVREMTRVGLYVNDRCPQCQSGVFHTRVICSSTRIATIHAGDMQLSHILSAIKFSVRHNYIRRHISLWIVIWECHLMP